MISILELSSTWRLSACLFNCRNCSMVSVANCELIWYLLGDHTLAWCILLRVRVAIVASVWVDSLSLDFPPSDSRIGWSRSGFSSPLVVACPPGRIDVSWYWYCVCVLHHSSSVGADSEVWIPHRFLGKKWLDPMNVVSSWCEVLGSSLWLMTYVVGW